MNRRDFLKFAAAAGAWVSIPSGVSTAQTAGGAAAAGAVFDPYFITICQGFLKNARATSSSFAVCDYPGGTKLKGCCTPGGKTYVSVARMLPAMAEWIAARNAPVAGTDLRDVLSAVYAHAFDPKHEDFWGYAPSTKATQLTVESAMTAYSLWRLGDEVLGKLTSEQRANLQAWLARCTQVPERKTNHAWFTALNQSARLALSKKFPEFKGDEAWLIEDLKALDALFQSGNDGWYSDSPEMPIYDYYNFWTFGNFPLFWSLVAGAEYPDWAKKFRSRAKLFLEKAPYFFDDRGGLPLMGRSLMYRWDVLSPMVLGYQQGVWPHAPGLLRRIMRMHFDYHWRQLGCYDPGAGKLRESLSAGGTHDVREAYADNGHPYWCMQAFTFLSIPASDPLWSDPEQPLPIEQADYTVKFPGPGMVVAGTKSSGQVRWVQARNAPKRDIYRDRYTKLAWSSSFPYNILQNQRGEIATAIPWDQAVVFRTREGKLYPRVSAPSGKLLDDGVETVWTTSIDNRPLTVRTTVRLMGEFELRSHRVAAADPAVVSDLEIIEGSYPLGLEDGEGFAAGDGCVSAKTGKLAVWPVSGYGAATVVTSFGGAAHVNIVYPRMAVLTLAGELELGKPYVSLWYASPKPMSDEAIAARAKQIIAAQAT